MGWLRSTGRLATRQAIVVTDFDVQGMWFTPHVDRYFVAHAEPCAHLERLGVPTGTMPVLTYRIDRLLADPTRLAAMWANARRLARLPAARDITMRPLDAEPVGPDRILQVAGWPDIGGDRLPTGPDTEEVRREACPGGCSSQPPNKEPPSKSGP